MKHVYFVSCPRVFHIEELWGDEVKEFDYVHQVFLFADSPEEAVTRSLELYPDYWYADDEDGLTAEMCSVMLFASFDERELRPCYLDMSHPWLGELCVDELGLVLDFGFDTQLPIMGYAEVYRIPIVGRVPIELLPDTPAKRALQALL